MTPEGSTRFAGKCKRSRAPDLMYVEWRRLVPGSISDWIVGSESRDAACRVFVLRGFSRTGEDARRSIAVRDNLRFGRGGLKGVASEPVLELLQGKFTLQSMAFFAVAD